MHAIVIRQPRAATITYNSPTLLRYWRLPARLPPLGDLTRAQRACRVQIVIHLVPGVFETRRSEPNPLRRGILAVVNRVFQSISAQFTRPRETAALFFQRLMVSTL